MNPKLLEIFKPFSSNILFKRDDVLDHGCEIVYSKPNLKLDRFKVILKAVF